VPWMSASRGPTLNPSIDRTTAKSVDTVFSLTPPFQLITMIRCLAWIVWYLTSLGHEFLSPAGDKNSLDYTLHSLNIFQIFPRPLVFLTFDLLFSTGKNLFILQKQSVVCPCIKRLTHIVLQDPVNVRIHPDGIGRNDIWKVPGVCLHSIEKDFP